MALGRRPRRSRRSNEWYKSAFAGNGTLGVMLWQQRTDGALHVDVCSSQIWDDRRLSSSLRVSGSFLNGPDNLRVNSVGNFVFGRPRARAFAWATLR